MGLFLFMKLESTKKEMQNEIEAIKIQAQKDIQSAKDDQNKEILSLKAEIESLKNDPKIDRNTDKEAMNNSTSIDVSEYLMRSRNITRTSHMNTIATALSAFYSDQEAYPMSDPSGCVPQKELNQNYFPKWTPTDPQIDHIHDGCINPSQYAYRGFGKTIRNKSSNYALGATLEWENSWNSAKPLSEYSQEELESGDINSQLSKWNGKYYIIID